MSDELRPQRGSQVLMPSSATGPRAERPAGGDPTVPDITTAIEGTDVSLRFGTSAPVLEDMTLRVAQGEILVIIGPSGCGKSTLLNLLSGVLRPTSGQIECYGQLVNGLNRRVAYLTQKDTLLPWRTALDNAAMALEIKGVGRKERREKAREVLEQVGVGASAHLRPHQLSGGMRSRVSLARSLLSDADIFLMDEPFSAIDALQRVRLQQLLVDLWQATGKTMVYVTHDLEEAISLGHRVIVMGRSPGRIAVEREVPVPQPRNVALFRTTPVARELYEDLWDALERQFQS